MAIYQRTDAQDQMVHVNADPALQCRSIKDLPDSSTSIVECPPPPLKPKGPINAKFSPTVKELPVQIRMQDTAWLLGRSVTRFQAENFQAIEATEQLDTQTKKLTTIVGGTDTHHKSRNTSFSYCASPRVVHTFDCANASTRY